jgi:hypothetical protein
MRGTVFGIDRRLDHVLMRRVLMKQVVRNGDTIILDSPSRTVVLYWLRTAIEAR